MVVVICSDASVVEAVGAALERGAGKTGARKGRSNVSFRIFSVCEVDLRPASWFFFFDQIIVLLGYCTLCRTLLTRKEGDTCVPRRVSDSANALMGERVGLTHRKSFVRLAMGAFPQVLAIS
jgi:hypothetical protein